MASGPPRPEAENIAAAAAARQEIERAIETIDRNQAQLTEGQIKAIKRIIYSSPAPQGQPGGKFP